VILVNLIKKANAKGVAYLRQKENVFGVEDASSMIVSRKRTCPTVENVQVFLVQNLKNGQKEKIQSELITLKN